MSNIFKRKHSDEEVSLIHMGKMEKSKETVAIYEVEADRTIMVMPLDEFNNHFEQNDFTEHDHFTKDQ
jgi:hypothetical protein